MIIYCILFFNLTYFREVGQRYRNIFVRFLVQMKTSKNHSEINWHLDKITKKEFVKKKNFKKTDITAFFKFWRQHFFVKMRPAKGLKKFTRSKKAHPSDYVTFLTNYHDAGPNLVRIIFRQNILLWISPKPIFVYL